MVRTIAQGGEGKAMTESDRESIQDKVRFWEEQDKINQELIPRVIRQNELLARHIAEHDALPELAAKAVSQAVREVKEENNRRFEAALLDAKEQLVAESLRMRNRLIGLTIAAMAVAVVSLGVNVLA